MSSALLQSLHPLAEILIIGVIFNYLFSFFWNTRSMDLLLGIFVFLLLFGFSTWFYLPVLQQIMFMFGNVAMLAALIIFQPELRVALSKLSWKGKRYREISEFDKFLDQLATSVYRLAEKRIGALVVLERKHSLEEYANSAVLLDAHFSPELLETIFATSTPLHDGAVIIRDRRLIAASVILPLAEESSQVTKAMGTRHRAALGASQVTDAVILAVSEETGRVSVAREGIMTRGIKIDRFKGILRSIFTAPSGKEFQSAFRLMEWIKQ